MLKVKVIWSVEIILSIEGKSETKTYNKQNSVIDMNTDIGKWNN